MTNGKKKKKRLSQFHSRGREHYSQQRSVAFSLMLLFSIGKTKKAIVCLAMALYSTGFRTSSVIAFKAILIQYNFCHIHRATILNIWCEKVVIYLGKTQWHTRATHTKTQEWGWLIAMLENQCNYTWGNGTPVWEWLHTYCYAEQVRLTMLNCRPHKQCLGSFKPMVQTGKSSINRIQLP